MHEKQLLQPPYGFIARLGWSTRAQVNQAAATSCLCKRHILHCCVGGFAKQGNHPQGWRS
jgi:hypothetical protein